MFPKSEEVSLNADVIHCFDELLTSRKPNMMMFPITST